jgi:hypothetical protein|tara:strand:+ start:349 stop:579 length:231 start_codon:yes stop_codon:yes gene_type:complete
MVDEETISPKWDNIVSMYDDLDNLVGKYVSEKEMNYLEVECALMMLREKINESKIGLIIEAKKSTDDKEKTSDIYK